jgi:hypothetical protein
MLLAELAHARSGDKSGSANIGIMVVRKSDVPRVARALTPARIRRALGLPKTQAVQVFALPRLGAFNVLLPDVLGGAPPYSLCFDVFGHYLGSRILSLEVDDE